MIHRSLGSDLEARSRLAIKRVQSRYWYDLCRHRNRVLSALWVVLVASVVVSAMILLSSAIVYNNTRITRIDMESKLRRRMAEIESRACIVYPKLCSNSSSGNSSKKNGRQ